MVLDGPDQLWVADITYVAIATGFVYVAVILDAWSRRVVGYAISRSIDARLTLAALKAAIDVASRPRDAFIIPTADRKADSNGRRNTARHLLAYASHRSSASAGVLQSSVFRGLALSAAATAAISWALWMLRSVPFGKYCRSSPLVFSLVPRCHGLCGSQK